MEWILQKGGAIDEITANDVAMAQYIKTEYSDFRLNLGRLFFKVARDIRIDEYYNAPFLSSGEYELAHELGAVGIELDLTHRQLSGFTHNCDAQNIFRAFHVPFCYISTGNICKFASIHQKISHKFRPNFSCQMECQHIAECNANTEGKDKALYRIGRTIYFFVPNYLEYLNQGDRFLYFPAREFGCVG